MSNLLKDRSEARISNHEKHYNVKYGFGATTLGQDELVVPGQLRPPLVLILFVFKADIELGEGSLKESLFLFNFGL